MRLVEAEERGFAMSGVGCRWGAGVVVMLVWGGSVWAQGQRVAVPPPRPAFLVGGTVARPAVGGGIPMSGMGMEGFHPTVPAVTYPVPAGMPVPGMGGVIQQPRVAAPGAGAAAPARRELGEVGTGRTDEEIDAVIARTPRWIAERILYQQVPYGGTIAQPVRAPGFTDPMLGRVQPRSAVPLFGFPASYYPTTFVNVNQPTGIPIPPPGYPAQAYPVPVYGGQPNVNALPRLPNVPPGNMFQPSFPQYLSVGNVGSSTITYTPYTPLTATYFSYPSQTSAVPLYTPAVNSVVGMGPNTYTPVNSTTNSYTAGYSSTINAGQVPVSAPSGTTGP